MTPDQKKLTIAAIVIALIIASIELFRYMKPGVYFKYKCNNGGDDTRKFYDPTWQARGAVCDGLYIPISAKLSGANTTRVLEWMGEIIAAIMIDETPIIITSKIDACLILINQIMIGCRCM